MRIDIGWLLFAVVMLAGMLALSDSKSSSVYDKRNWACAEYDVDVEKNEQICVRLERTINK